tara:strand:- start:268 stop:486 length:219 start_codon:yes stop_codon:yes gene_type:complete
MKVNRFIMKNNIEITIDEIKEVAKECKFEEPTQEQIKYIIENYNDKADEDPNGYWRLWVEQLLYDADVSKTN